MINIRLGDIMKPGWKKKTIEKCFKVKSGEFLPAKIMIKEGNIDVYGGNGITGQHNQYNRESWCKMWQC
jgi:hypothetical protein